MSRTPYLDSNMVPGAITIVGTEHLLQRDTKHTSVSSSPGPSESSKGHLINVDNFNSSVMPEPPHYVRSENSKPCFSFVDLTYDEDDAKEVSYGCIITRIVGMQYYDGIASPGEQVLAIREPENPYDGNAIKITNVNNVQIGHIPRTMAAKLASFMDEGTMSWDAMLQLPVNYYNSGLSITIYGPSDEMQKTTFMDRLKSRGIILKDLETTAREMLKKDKKARKRVKMEQKMLEKHTQLEKKRRLMIGDESYGNVLFSGDPLVHQVFNDVAHVGMPPSDAAWQELFHISVQFNPRDVQSVIDKICKGEDELKSMPYASQPSAIKTRLLPYQLQGLAWLLKHENPELPCQRDELVQLWRQHPEKKECYENVATKYTCKKSELENSLCSGGILSDDMGLGKTLEIISLICVDVMQEKELVRKPREIAAGCTGTLIIAPVSVMSNWSNQISSHIFKNHKLSVYLNHGNARKTHNDLSNYDVVITSYGILTSDFDNQHTKNNIFSFNWRRIVLDEAHQIRNPKAKVSLAAANLKGESRWCLTGTPIINNLKDLFSLIRFIGLGGGLSQWEYFNSVVIRPLNRGGSPGLLQAILGQLCLRRMKDMKFIDLKIPPLTEYIQRVPWTKDERKKYDLLLTDAQRILTEYVNASNLENGNAAMQYRYLLEILLRMRQLCNHHSLCGPRMTALLEFGKDIEEKNVEMNPENVALLQDLLQLAIDAREDCPICLEELHNPVITVCKHYFGLECINHVIKRHGKCPMCRAELPDSQSMLVEARTINEDDKEPNTGQVDESTSSKLEALKNILQANKFKQDGSKVVIFSQWTSFLNIIQAHIKLDGYCFSRIDGQMNAKKRDVAMEKFDTDPECTIMLASLAVCSVGLNFTSANIVILMDPWWAPAIEDQAIDRVHRLGQKKPTHAFRLVMEDSIEDRVLEIQAKKKKLISDAFMDQGKKKQGHGKEARLTDLTMLLQSDKGKENTSFLP